MVWERRRRRVCRSGNGIGERNARAKYWRERGKGEEKKRESVGWVYAENRGQKPAEIFNKAAHCVGERQKGWQAAYIMLLWRIPSLFLATLTHRLRIPVVKIALQVKTALPASGGEEERSLLISHFFISRRILCRSHDSTSIGPNIYI